MTYVRLVMFTVEPRMRSTIENIVVNEMIPQIITGGIPRLTMESKEDAEGAKEALLPILERKISGIAKGQPVTKLYEMYEPKA